MVIKQREFGTGRPLVCVPVIETEEDKIYCAAESAVCQGAEVLEWRMDWFLQIKSWEQTRRVLRRLQELCKDVILLCTFRSRPQGGEREISALEYQGLLERTAESGYADLLDVEAPRLTDAESVIQDLHSCGQRVIASSHYFSHTPEASEMQRELLGMYEAGADVGKLAVMPESPADVLKLLEATVQMKERYPDYPLVTMAMGSLGMITRVSGQTFGSCMTFASIGKASAPGQLPLEDVRMILDRL